MAAARKIGDYTLVRLLGKGGMSEVYEVEDERLGSRHALKLFTYEKDDADVRRRFETEGRLLAKLRHPRIVRVTDYGTDVESGRPYFVMDLILDAKGTVRSLAEVAPGSVDEETIGRWYDDLREGLAYIHGNGVIHRDLKLQNVLIGPDDHAVLTDFGVSKIFEAPSGGTPVVDTVQTIVKLREGRSLVMGSLGYMAPELEMGVVASRESDWYALGVIVYRLLTGMWCDARTNLTETLDTYDPVWLRIVPKLLHANPQGRECLSYAEERAADAERQAAAMETRLDEVRQRGKLARHWARGFAALTACLAVVLLAGGTWVRLDRIRLLHSVRMQGGGGVAVPEFDELFRIPPQARADEVEDDQGRLVMPSRAQFEAAKIDALVLTHSLFSGMRTGALSPETAVARLEELRDKLSDESDASPFDELAIGEDVYDPVGEPEPLRFMLKQAAERLRQFADL